jgi:anti-sigma factor RsiW
MAKEAAVAEHTFAGLTCSDVQDLAAGFVLGALTPAESDSVRRHLAECPELHAEMAELNSVVPALFEAVDPIAPPAALKDQILAAAAADLEARRPMAQPAPAPSPAPPVRPAEPARGWDLGALFRRPVWAAMAVAALVAALALGAWNVQLRDQVAGLEAYRAGVVQVLDAAAKPGAQLAVLQDPSGAGGPSGLAAVGADGNVAIAMRNLTPTTGSQVYEAWVIGADQVPVAIGGFEVDSSGAASFVATNAPVAAGVVVALTLEPQVGATTPTLPIRAAGAARAQAS